MTRIVATQSYQSLSPRHCFHSPRNPSGGRGSPGPGHGVPRGRRAAAARQRRQIRGEGRGGRGLSDAGSRTRGW